MRAPLRQRAAAALCGFFAARTSPSVCEQAASSCWVLTAIPGSISARAPRNPFQKDMSSRTPPNFHAGFSGQTLHQTPYPVGALPGASAGTRVNDVSRAAGGPVRYAAVPPL
ncbi:hypothetical protein ABZ357_39115 [Streptomyces sp. NPDC005917]|uniref:hypothetical protein n=1 Tax=unclassified Streptomyces TaxID=2593676 RepID=UPI0033C032FB